MKKARAASGRKDLPAPPEKLIEMYRTMALIRRFEESLRVLASGGAAPGLVHLCAGQEGTNVGVIAALEPDDYIASHHRGHGHCLAKGASPQALMDEILGKATGICGGRSGSMHIFDPAHGNLGTNGIVGGGIPLAAGAALSIRARKSKQVAVCFFGDGALNQGLIHECMNMAAVWKLPVIFVCENNGYGEFTAIEDVTAGAELIARGKTFDIPSRMIDGMNVIVVYEAMRECVKRARSGEGPSFLICNTWRFGGHHVGDKQEYKNSEEAKAWRARDPLLQHARFLAESGIADEAAVAAIETECADRMRAVVAAARTAPEPAASELMSHVHG
jgi:pyruvate dehydrogenase E1 component alpha subunit